MLRLGTVEIDHVQTPETDALKLLGHIQRLTIDRLLVVVTFGQSDALAVDDIDGRN